MSSLEAIAYPKYILKNLGLWPKKKISVKYTLRTLVSLLLIFILLFCLTLNTISNSGDFVKLSESLYMLTSVLNSFLKAIMLMLNGDVILMSLSSTKTTSFLNYSDRYAEVIDKFTKIVKKIELVFRFQVNGTLIFIVICPVLESKSLPMDFPYFNNGTFHYPFYIFESVSLCFAAYNNMGSDLLVVGMISIAAMQMAILNKKLVDTDKNVANFTGVEQKDVEKYTLAYLNECCMHYSDIEGYVRLLVKAFSINIFIQLSISVMAICNSGMMILNVEPVSLEALSLFFYISAMLAQLGMYCLLGNLVYLESLKVNTSCYMFEWYMIKTNARKTLFILMERTKRPLEIKGINLVPLSFNTFISILKCTYSYFTLLRKHNMQQR